jgi:nitrate/TMAO reductase-like tetraheme cytochrome c subunit
MLFSMSATSAVPAYYHDLEKNRQPCADCHTLHYSEGGAQPAKVDAGGPFAQLLIRATTTKLCLFCHDGSDPKAPDVLLDVTMYDGSGDEHSGAGFFANSGGTANDKGHDLGLNSSSVPFSSKTNMTLTCASCHDPHGTPNYRNVLTAPAGGTGIGVEMAKDVFRDLPPGDPPSAAASISAYKESNEGYKAQTSKWCVECHDSLKPHVGGSSRDPNISHHLVDVSINNWSPPIVDPAHWVDGTGSGFGATTGDDVEGVPRLRFQVSGATDFVSSKAVAANNQVICGSCHLAHGGKYKKGLVWPHKDSGVPVDKDSGCQQCHNK